jgi:hypothetical protein
MVRRNRACAPCRQRRIRCDETRPQCQQCLKTGRACPGPLEGPIMVDMTSSIASRVQHPHSRPHKRTRLAITEVDQSPSSHQVMMQLFVDQYLRYFCGHLGDRQKPWMQRRYENIMVVDLPLHAAALAYYATHVDRPDALVKSHDLYITALGKQRSLVGQALNGRWSQESLAQELVSSNLMLAYFETMHSTSLDAYGLHIHAAAKFLQHIGPKCCETGLLNQLFFAVRAQLVGLISKFLMTYADQTSLSSLLRCGKTYY